MLIEANGDLMRTKKTRNSYKNDDVIISHQYAIHRKELVTFAPTLFSLFSYRSFRSLLFRDDVTVRHELPYPQSSCLESFVEHSRPRRVQPSEDL